MTNRKDTKIKLKIIGISGKMEMAVGLRCSGIECDYFEDGNVLDKIKQISCDSDIGIIIITDDLYKKEYQEIDNFRIKNKMPLIVRI